VAARRVEFSAVEDRVDGVEGGVGVEASLKFFHLAAVCLVLQGVGGLFNLRNQGVWALKIHSVDEVDVLVYIFLLPHKFHLRCVDGMLVVGWEEQLHV